MDTNTTVDLFEQLDTLPQDVQDIINSFDDNSDNPYNECERLESLLKPHGYTFDWGLSGEPCNLQKIK